MARDIAAERRDIDETVRGQTVCSLFQEMAERHGEVPALRWKRNGDWETITWKEEADLVRDAANGLAALGFRPGEFANILSSNRWEYYVADLAILHAGGTPVSLYNTLAPEQIEYIVNHCESVVMILENRAFLDRILQIRDRIPRIRKVVLLDATDAPDDDWVISWDALLEDGRKYGEENPGTFDERWKKVDPKSLATLIYTSGTTGPPKGVMVSHYNVCWTAESLDRIFPRRPGMRHISYLPMAHIAERMAGYYLQVKGASTCYFCPDARQIGEYLVAVKPQFFLAVPRIWEKLYYGLTAAIGNNPDEGQRKFAKEALEAGLEKVRLEQDGKPLPPELQEKLPNVEMVGKMIRERVGLDEIEVASTGAAPIGKEIIEFFHAVGVPIAEVYGQSEDTGPTSWNRPEDIRIGTVGPTVPGVEVKLLDDGELCVRGGNVVEGYYKEPELTRETFDEEGWLHSGDVAEIDGDGFIRIVDRKKEILITAGGKNIAPSNIENMLKQKPLIGQACVIGDKRPYCSALIVLDAETAQGWARQQGLPEDLAELASHPKVEEEVQAYIDEINTHLHNQEQVKRFTILPREWTPDSGELTPTLKMKRKVVNQRYTDEIEAMYAAPRKATG